MFRLEVHWEDQWRTVKMFRTPEDANRHLEETKAIRMRGDTPIVEGRIVRIADDEVVANIEPYDLPEGPSMAEAAATPKGAMVGVNVNSEEKSVEGPGNG